MRNPLVILLIVLATISFATGDARAGTVMTLMVILGVLLRFVQEARADAAAEKLKAMINVTAAVVRAGKEEEIPLKQLVPGDVVTLSAGDMIPADVRIISAKDLFISQATLTGESLPVEKFDTRETRAEVSPLELANICFLGTSVESGAATAVVLATGAQTYFGSMAGSIVGEQVADQLRQRHAAVHLADDPLHDGDGAAGLPHQWLHQAQLARSLLFLHRRRRRADAGDAADDRLRLPVEGRARDVEEEGHREATQRDPELRRDGRALHGQDRHADDGSGHPRTALRRDAEGERRGLRDAYLIAHFQTGLKNVLDRAVLSHRDAHEEIIAGFRKVDEIPFDFVRRMMSVVVEKPDGDHQLLTKGAPEAIFPRCTFFELDGETFPMEPLLVGDLMQQYQQLSADGFRVLAVAHKHLDTQPFISKEDECDLILKGYVAFLDPPKERQPRRSTRSKSTASPSKS